MTEDQKEVTRRRKGHKEVTREGGPRRPEGAGKTKKTLMEGNAKAEAMETKGRETLEAPKLVEMVEGDDNGPEQSDARQQCPRRREEHDGPTGRQKREKNRDARGKPAET